MIKVYVASKIRHADFLLKIRAIGSSTGVHFNARWIETCNLAINATKPVSHWQCENFDDIERSDAVFCYAETGEHLKGALVEIGYAIRAGKPIFIIGQKVTPLTEGDTSTSYHPDFEPWSHFNPLQVHRARDFEEGMRMVKQLFKDPQ